MIESYEEALSFVPDSDIRNWVGPFQDKSFYHDLGLSQARKVKEWLNIGPTSSVLDVGCGCGRLALHFLNEIGTSGTYGGVDCSPSLVDFCRRNLSPRNPVFSFLVLDSQNGAYNPQGTLNPQTVRLPFEDQTFTAALAWSVFTHMDFESVRNYLAETRRVLVEGGRFCFTLNLHDPNTLARMAGGEFPLNLSKIEGTPSYTINPERPEECFSHSKEAIEAVLAERGFEILESMEGWWSFGTPQGEYHDGIVCQKKAL